MRDITDKIKKYKIAGEDSFRVPTEGEHFELSAGLGWIQHIVKEEEIKRVNTDYVVEIIWELSPIETKPGEVSI